MIEAIMTTPFALELEFTDTYRRYLDANPAIREAQCLKVLVKHIFDPPQPGDLFAGRTHYPAVGFGLELAAGGPIYYCHTDQIRPKLELLPETLRHQVEKMLAFWAKEASIDGHLIRRLPEETLVATSNPIAEMGGRLAGTLLNFENLVHLGIPGLRTEIEKGTRGNGDLPLYQAMTMALDLLVEVIHDYADQTRGEMKQTLKAITSDPPQTFREAAQLAWLYALISGTVNYGRMDVYLGDFFARDIDSGLLSEAEGLSLVQSLWRLIAARKTIFNGRVFLGGVGRPNEINADRFALAAMEATRTVIEVEPQLTLRFYQGMNPDLMQKAMDVIGEGRTFPMLYNDDVNISAVESAFCISKADAEQYLPYGCGEYAINHTSVGSPNCSLNMLKALEAVLHQGMDRQTGRQIGVVTQPLSDFTSFDRLWDAYCAQVAFSVQHLATRHKMEVDLEAEEAAFLFVSMLYDDCILRGKSLLDGGVRIKGGLIETYGMVNAADSLTAIKTLVYDQKVISLQDLVTVLDADFAGFEREYRWMKAAPKFGNDDPVADDMLCRVSTHVAKLTRAQAERVGLDYFLIVNINNYMNVTLGKQTMASAEGRLSGKPLANGNTPTAGNDINGVTAFLNSLVKADAATHAGYTQNMKFSKSLFQNERTKLEALMGTYFACGGTQAMITVIGREDLENALKEPEKHRNLIVRVGGFSARFVELAPEIQQDLLARTLY
jgi:pyruvate-formate lyase